MKTWRATLTMVAAMVAIAALPSTAAANDLFTLDPSPTSAGHVIQDGAGNAYIAWTSLDGSGADVPRYCKVAPGGSCSPITLPVPGGTSLDGASGAFPVFGSGETVYVVAPRYVRDDIVVYTSFNGGASFGAGVLHDYYSNKTDPTDVFLRGSEFVVGAYNAGLGFSSDEVSGPGGDSLSFADPGPGGVAGASMALSGSNPVIAYWNFSSPQYGLFFYRFKGSGLLNTEANWEGPVKVTDGYAPSLASGPAGLFMVSEDYNGGQYPTAINLRKFDGTSFGAPRTIAVEGSPNLYAGGAIAQSPGGGRLAVAWPGPRSDGAYVMRLFTSTDSGATFTESHIAHLGDGYAINENAELTTGEGGNGWLTFRDSSGLHLADLNPIAGLPPAEPPLPPIYKGKTKVVTKKVGNFLIVLRLPKSCLQSRQRFFVGVGKRKRKQLSKRLGGEIRFTKVVFIYDGKKLKVKKKKPFRYLIDPGPLAPKSVHRVKAKVTLILTKGNKEKKIKRTIKGTVRAC